MSYQAIARRWRSLSFDQLVGQDHVTTTLRNALENDRLHHALLFTGPRGTGKTSSARILAKSLRCPNAVNFVPCNKCQTCEEINLGRSVDVIEIDGASNNGVDSIRELRDSVGFMPSSGTYKVYIIDEVHMLSGSAFNALLKTLEEPPAHVIFILATTEVHKIPATILSRCQRYDFRRISTRVIAERLALICKTDGFQCEEDALWLLARQGDGSMRDSQSLLDQVITFSTGDVSKENVVSILGLSDHHLLKQALEAIVQKQPTVLANVFSQMNTVGIDPGLFLENLIEDLRHLSMVKMFQDQASEFIDLSDAEIRFLKDLSINIQDVELQMLFDIALKGASDLNRASNPRWVMEMVLLRLATAPKWIDINQVLMGSQGSKMPVVEAAPAPAPTVARAGSSAPAKPASLARSGDLSPSEKWYEFVQKIKKIDPLFGAKIEPLFFIKAENGKLELSAPAKMSFLRDQLVSAENKKKLEGLLEQNWGAKLSVDVAVVTDAAPTGSSAKGIAQEKAQKKDDDLLEQVAKNPKVMTFNRVFQGKVQGFTEKKK
jgi:DNA polymerase-3 subunit gamma/tau